MKELINKILIVNGVFVILFTLLVITERFFKSGFAFSLFDIIGFIYSWVFPIFIILTCLLYQHKNRDFVSYGKSLLIPLSYVLFGSILLFPWVFIVFQGEAEGFAILFFLIQSGIIFIAVLVVNLIYLFIDKAINKKIKDKSIGVIPVFSEDTKEDLFLVVLHKGGHWAFPKGHKKTNENDLDTAKRELYEETGIKNIKLENEKEFFEFYSFEKDGKKHDKQVKYFIGFVSDTNKKITNEFKHEIKQIKWLNYSEALSTITFKESQNLLNEVKKYLEK